MSAPQAPLLALLALCACAPDSHLFVDEQTTSTDDAALTAFVKPTPSSVRLAAGESLELTVRLGTERGPWALSVVNLPPGLSASFTQDTLAGGESTTLALTAAPDANDAAVFAMVKARAGNRTLNGGLRVVVVAAAQEPTPDAGPPEPPEPTWTDDGPRHGPPYRVLFDAAHRQTEGNSYWILDAQMPAPDPARPSRESDWTGGISAWGFELLASRRYLVSQLPPGSALNYGRGGAGDLSGYDVFISVEPQSVFTAAESQALLQFSRRGRGILFIGNHLGAQRCSSCAEAWEVVNGFLEGPAADVFGVKVDGNHVGRSGLTGRPVTASSWTPRFTQGPFGAATGVTYFSGSTVSVVGVSRVAQLIASSSSGGMLVASHPQGHGRLVLLGDSSPADDGTCACGANLHRGWQTGTNRQLLLNATAWLARDGS